MPVQSVALLSGNRRSPTALVEFATVSSLILCLANWQLSVAAVDRNLPADLVHRSYRTCDIKVHPGMVIAPIVNSKSGLYRVVVSQ